MPIYEFRCTKCDHTFEELVLRSRDLEELECPECSSGEVELLISSPAGTPTGGTLGAGSSGAPRRCGPSSFS
jgi:putative FmdB family regulatory protein